MIRGDCMDKMDSEYIGSTKIMSIDEAKEKKGVKGLKEKEEEFEKDVVEKQDHLFTDIMSVVFGWKTQPDNSKKLVSKLPNGKIIFPDRSEELERLEPGVPYICLVYEREREAFAKICAEEYQPKIFVLANRIVTMVWRNEKGKLENKMPHANTFEERINAAVKEMETLGFASAKIIFRKNQ